jgi:beta-N-acetylhexosaminidase
MLSDITEAIGGHICIGISGLSLTEDEKKFILNNNISGVTLFARNVKDPRQVFELTQELHQLSHQMKSKAPFIVAIDMEGGRVARLKNPFTEWPALKAYGDLDSPTVSFLAYQSLGHELAAVGINVDFAPCLDIFTNPQNQIIGDRSVGSDPELVAKHGSALIRGLLKAGVLPCIKHFPGHGHTLIDSHEDLPIEEADLERLRNTEMIPFKKAFKSKANFVMTAHIRFKNIDPDWPVTLSEKFLKNILRDELRFNGMVITDDLDMKAMAKHYAKDFIPVRALQAGADMLLYCNEPESQQIAVEAIKKAVSDGKLSAAHLEATYKRNLEFRVHHVKDYAGLSWEKSQKMVGHADHKALSEAVKKGSVPANLIQKLQE